MLKLFQIICFAILAGCGNKTASDHESGAGIDNSATSKHEMLSSNDGAKIEQVITDAISRIAKENEHSIIYQVFPELYRYFNDPKVNDFIDALWNNKANRYPGIKWDVVQKPIVRVAIAQFWGQIARANDQQGQLKDAREYIQEMLNHDDPDVRGAAAQALGAVGSIEDIKTLKEIVLKDKPSVAIDAAIGIRMIGGKEAFRALKDLEGQTRNPDVNAMLKRLLNKHDMDQ